MKEERDFKNKYDSPTFVLVHGSWHNGNCWDKVKLILENENFQVLTPTLTGMNSIEQPASDDVGLTRHIEDLLEVIEKNKLKNVILVGHSYAGLVITGVASQIPEKISQLIYLDAFIPENNKSLFDISNPERVDAMKKSLVDADGKTLEQGAKNVWLLPPRKPEFFGVTNTKDIEFLSKNLVYTPVLTFEEKIQFNPATIEQISKIYIRCTATDVLARFEDVAKNLGMSIYKINTGHDVMITEPEQVSKILLENLPYN